MILTRVHPGPAESFGLDAETTRARLLELYACPQDVWLRLNLVTSVSGSAAGSDGTSETLTSVADRRILGVIRELSDIVLVGAASVRAEGYQLPRRSTLAIVTASGDLAGHQLTVDDPSRIVVVCPPSAIERVRSTLGDATILSTETHEGRIPPSAIVEALRGAGYASIVCEGGPDLAAQLVSAGLVDEVCMTTSPVLAAVSLAPFGAELTTAVPLDLTQLLVDSAGSIYARWSIASGASPATRQ
ncbi:MAG: dihydrofolate reductase family protein [Rhodoglobus sp.]